MKLQISAGDLQRELGALTRIASGRIVNPTLSGVQISAKSGEIALNATDQSLSLQSVIPGEVEDPGTVVLPAKLLQDIARQASSANISLEFRPAENDVELRAGGAVFHLRTLRNEDFPQLPAMPTSDVVTVPAESFATTSSRVVRCAAKDEARPLLSCVLVRAEADSLMMVATDSYRLAEKTTKLEQAISGSFEANVPARAMQEVERLISTEAVETVDIARTENQVIFKVGKNLLSSRLIDGVFPQHRALIPESFDHIVELDARELKDVVSRVSLLSGKSVVIKLEFTEGELTVSSQAQDVGEASESLPVPFNGETLSIGFNHTYLREALEMMEDERVQFKLTSPIRPGVIQTLKDDSFLYLLMPIRLSF